MSDTAQMGDTTAQGSPAADEDVRRIQLELGVLIAHARRSIREAATHVHPDLQASGYAILFHLVQEGPALARGLAESFGLDKAAISRQVAQLEQLGLVARTPHPIDGRAQLLTVTDEGRRRCADDIDRRAAVLRSHLSGWSAEDLHALGSLLGRLNGSISRR